MLATFSRRHRDAFWQFTGMALIASMVLFGGPAAVLAQTETSSTTTDQVAGEQGGTDTASTTDTSATSTSSVVSVGDDGTSTTTSAVENSQATSTDTATSSDGVPAFVGTGDATSSVSTFGTANTGLTETGSSTASTTVANDSELAAGTTASSTAQTGSNGASDSDGAGIRTGSADSFGALISLFNIVITNSAGRLIFLQNPLGGIDLTSQIMGAFSSESDTVGTSTCTLVACDSPYGSLTAVTTGSADITNTLLVRSGTGINAVESTNGPALVETGDASAFGSIVNIGNLQIIDSRYLVILLNNIGDLIGDIVLPTADFFASLSTSALLSGDQSIVADNTADVNNNAVSTADTGLNAATGTQSATIESGQANSGVDLHNFINQNSLGGRPVCFIVSVGGTWDGKVIGLPKNFSEENTPFGKIICGSGTVSSTKVTSRLNASTTNYAKILNNAIVEATTGNNSASGTIAKIKTGNADAFLQILNLVNQNIIGQDWMFALFTISGNWKGDLMFGSREFWDAVNAQMAVINNQGSSALRLGPANVSIEKQSNPAQITASSTVGYAIKIKNTGDPVYHAKLVDTIYDPNHKAIHRQVWDLETIGADEEIGLSYTVVFAASSTPGVYTNEAYLDGYDQNPDIAHNLGRRVNSPVTKATLTVLGEPQQSLTERSEQVCEPYIKSYIKYGEANDPADVMRLQNFFIGRGSADIKLTGLYDAATRDAVKLFQEEHASEILAPWGIQTATGYVYYTTQRAINETYCDGTQTFGFSPLQQEEIERYRASLELRRLQGEVIPQEEINNRVGQADTDTRLALDDTPTQSDATEVAQAESEGVSQTAAAIQAVSSATTSVLNRIRSMIGSIFSR